MALTKVLRKYGHVFPIPPLGSKHRFWRFKVPSKRDLFDPQIRIIRFYTFLHFWEQKITHILHIRITRMHIIRCFDIVLLFSGPPRIDFGTPRIDFGTPQDRFRDPPGSISGPPRISFGTPQDHKFVPTMET